MSRKRPPPHGRAATARPSRDGALAADSKGEHGYLLAELARLDLMLQRQVMRLRARHQLVDNEFRGMFIPDSQVDALLQRPPAAEGGLTSVATLGREIEQMRVQNGKHVTTPAADQEAAPPLVQLRHLFALDAAEMDLLLIALAPALDLRYEILYGYVQNDVAKKRPTVDLALKLLYATPGQRLGARDLLNHTRPLRRHRLLQLAADPQDTAPPLVAHYLLAEERIVNFVLGHARIDARLAPLARVQDGYGRPDALPLPAAVRQQACAVVDFLRQQPGFVFLTGPYGVGKQETAGAMSAALGRRLLTVDLRAARDAGLPLADLIALLRREATLQRAALYLGRLEALQDNPQQVAALIAGIAPLASPVFLGGTAEWFPDDAWPALPVFHLALPLPDYQQRRQVWRAALDGTAGVAAADLDALANKFTLSAGQITEAADYAASLAALGPAGERALTAASLHAAARFRSNQALRELAQKVEPRYRWGDIVLPRHSKEQLHEVYLSVKHRQRVYSEWGFEQKLSLGKGINALFFGPSGTGKTMAAEIVANELALDLYKIDLSTVISKYIGETEKNLSQIFDAAQASNAILFFDEADALFGKRSEVKDARDRYANIEVAYLLQKMEEYDGIAVLATNLRGNMDDAFVRRLHHTVEFPFPDSDLRRRIWEGVFPAAAPLADDVDFHFLAAQFDLAGGNIRNVALSAAFLAAESGGAICMEQLVLGVARELQKLGKLPARADFRHYYPLVRL